MEPDEEIRLRGIFEAMAEVRKRACEDSLFEFLLDAWRIIEPGEEMVVNWHIPYVCKQLQEITEQIAAGEEKEHDLIINIPPGTTKSTIVSAVWNAWTWIKYPHLRFITSAHSAEISIGEARSTRDIILSAWYQRNWGDRFKLKGDANRVKFYENDKGGFRMATSTGSGITGEHADIFIGDDLIDPRKSESETLRKEANTWLSLTALTRFRNPAVGVFVLVMQRLHEDDPTGFLLKLDPDGWRNIVLPAEIDGEDAVRPKVLAKNYVDGLLDPVRLSRAVLAKMKIRLGTRGYAGQYQQRPGKKGGNIILGKWFGRFTMQDLRSIERANNAGKRRRQPVVWNFMIDSAYTKKQKNDPSAIMAWAWYLHLLYVRDVAVVRKTLPEMVRFIEDFAMRNGYGKGSRIYIEPKASGHSVAQQFKKQCSLNVQLDEAPTGSKEERAYAAQPFLESERVMLLDGAPFVDKYIAELEVFPNGKHDDQVDITTATIRRCEDDSGRIYAYG